MGLTGGQGVDKNSWYRSI